MQLWYVNWKWSFNFNPLGPSVKDVTWNHVVWFRTDGTVTDGPQLLNDFWDAWEDPIRAVAPFAANLDLFAVAFGGGIPGTVTNVSKFLLYGDVRGEYLSDTLPLQNVIPFTRRDGNAGRTGLGRFFLSGIGGEMFKDLVRGTIDTANARLVKMKTALMTPVTSAGLTFHPVLFHNLDNTTTDVTTVDVGARIKFQKSKRPVLADEGF